jgi:hypothetical protein
MIYSCVISIEGIEAGTFFITSQVGVGVLIYRSFKAASPPYLHSQLSRNKLGSLVIVMILANALKLS